MFSQICKKIRNYKLFYTTLCVYFIGLFSLDIAFTFESIVKLGIYTAILSFLTTQISEK